MTRPLTTLFLSIFLIAPIPALAQEADLDLIPAENDVASSTNPITTLDSSPASDSAIGSEDFDQVGSTEQVDSGQRKDITSISTSAYLDFTLNATGSARAMTSPTPRTTATPTTQTASTFLLLMRPAPPNDGKMGSATIY